MKSPAQSTNKRLEPKGTSGSQLDPLARHALWQAGLDFGHGVGSYLAVHEGSHLISKVPNTVGAAADLAGRDLRGDPAKIVQGILHRAQCSDCTDMIAAASSMHQSDADTGTRRCRSPY
jgi:hypothetical protein